MIISIHIRKCAGSTFREQLVNAYGDRVFFDYGDEIGSSWPTSVRKRMFSAENVTIDSKRLNESFSVIHGHFYRGKYEGISGNKTFITFVRNPAQRLVSNYLYLKRNFDRQNPDSLVVNKLDFSFEDYIKDVDSCNLQSRFLEATNLEGFEFVGVVEEYDKSIHKLNRILGVSLGPTASQNVNPSGQDAYQIDRQTQKLIMKYNEIDYELYRLAMEKLHD